MCSVNEGLVYVRIIEDNLDAKGELFNIRKTANVVWVGVDLYHKWLDVDLRKLSLQEDSTKEILEKLSDSAKNMFEEFKKTPYESMSEGRTFKVARQDTGR
ncbi:hypothetical protein OIU76_017984 [Salix suchowensis]|nr:hypothetical protein OIU76_017984 [Salix suchowensis]